MSTEILCLSESVDVLSLLDMYLPVFLVLLVCERVFFVEISETVTDTVKRLAKQYQHTCACANMQRSLAHP